LKILKSILVLILGFSVVAAAYCVANYQTVLNLFLEKEDVSLIDAAGNVVTGQTVKISAPKARDFIFWNTSIGVKPNNPKVQAIRVFLNFTLHDIKAPKDSYTENVWFYSNAAALVDSYGNIVGYIQTVSKNETAFPYVIPIGLSNEEIAQGINTVSFWTNYVNITANDIYWIFVTMEGIQPQNENAHIELTVTLGIKYAE